jgi:1,4-dihydroxy-2-naphthoyl-CoA hydrolase
MTFEPVVPLDQTFDAQYGLELLGYSEERVSARVALSGPIRQPFGLVHGGVYATMAEAMASMATAVCVLPEGNIAVGLSNATSFLRPITDGEFIHGVGVRRHRGRTTWVWDIDFTDDQGRLCATTRMTIAVRPKPAN